MYIKYTNVIYPNRSRILSYYLARRCVKFCDIICGPDTIATVGSDPYLTLRSYRNLTNNGNNTS